MTLLSRRILASIIVACPQMCLCILSTIDFARDHDMFSRIFPFIQEKTGTVSSRNKLNLESSIAQIAKFFFT